MENNKNKRGPLRAAPPSRRLCSPARRSSSRVPVPPSFLPSFLPGRYFKAGCCPASNPARGELCLQQQILPASSSGLRPSPRLRGQPYPAWRGQFPDQLGLSPLLETLLPPGEGPLSVGRWDFLFFFFF